MTDFKVQPQERRPDRSNAVTDMLRARRIELGLTVAEAAERGGISSGQVTSWEMGHRGFRIATVPIVAQVYDVDPEWLAVMLVRDAMGMEVIA